MYLEPSILTLNESLQVVHGRGIHMEVVAFVGSSGTGRAIVPLLLLTKIILNTVSSMMVF